MFETYGFKAAFIQVQAVLTLYAQGLLTGACNAGMSQRHVVCADATPRRLGG